MTAAIVKSGRRILLVRRAPGQSLAGMWEFPGGKLEPGESLQDCLARELMEELGLLVDVHEVVAISEYHYSHGSIQLVAMNVVVQSGELRLTVHDEARWLLPSEIASVALAPADLPIAAKLQQLDPEA